MKALNRLQSSPRSYWNELSVAVLALAGAFIGLHAIGKLSLKALLISQVAFVASVGLFNVTLHGAPADLLASWTGDPWEGLGEVVWRRAAGRGRGRHLILCYNHSPGCNF